jgi:hypothetical protein
MKVRAEVIPCLDSSQQCIAQLTIAALAHSDELKTLSERIALLDRRLGLAGEGIDYAHSKLWTNYLPDSYSTNPLTLINPFSWIKNLAGGGEMQRDRLAITDLEIKKAGIEAQKAELERQLSQVKNQLQEQILTEMLNYEAAERQSRAYFSQLNNQQILSQIVEIDYRFGDSSTEAYLTAVEKREKLENQLVQSQTARTEALRKLLALTGFDSPIPVH